MHESIFNSKVTLTTPSGLSSVKVDIIRTDNGIEIRLIDTNNIFSLWVYFLSSSDFYLLKKEQEILVDYERFIQILINLFHGVVTSKYNATFNEGILRFIENLEFRNICKLELKFSKPDETNYRRYLGDLISRMESDNIKLIKENSILRDKCINGDASLKEKIRYLESENADIKRKIDLFKRDFSEVEDIRRSKEEEISRITSRLYNVENENSHLKHELERYQRENSMSIKEQLRSKEDEVEELSKEINTANNVIKKLRQENSDLKQFKSDIEQLQSSEKDRTRDVQVKYDDLNAKYLSIENKYKKLKEDVKEKDLKIKELSESNKNLTKRLENAQNVYNHFYSRKVDEHDHMSDTFSLRPESPPPR